MAAVTALRADPRAPGFLLVEVDGARYASIPVERVRTLRLEVGAALDPASASGLAAVAAEEAAHRAALGALARRARAQGDLTRWLLRRGHEREVVRRAIERLVSGGLVDDRVFAREFAAARVRRGHGPSRLLRDLLARGVERSVAERAIREVEAADAADPAVEVKRLAERRARQLAGLPLAIRRRRVLAYLARRGHGGAAVRNVVDTLLSP